MSKKDEVKRFVLKKIKYFEATENSSNTNGELANLRRGVGKSPGEMPELYGILLKDMPEEFWIRDGETTAAEWSCYIALTLYAVHQQGNQMQVRNMHTDNRISVGRALRQMVSVQSGGKGDSNAEERALKKLQMLLTSKDMREFSYYLRNVVKLLKNERIALNYVQLAGDIYDFQYPEAKTKLSLAWGQDFYRGCNKEEKEDE